MAFITGIVSVAAFEFDRNDIKRGVPVNTAGLIICQLTFYHFAMIDKKHPG
jgi:hypothetical protein